MTFFKRETVVTSRVITCLRRENVFNVMCFERRNLIQNTVSFINDRQER